ncbi:methionine ABC transporter permease [Campylobacter pinnipediorum]|uniref:DL-methionine ABC transporter MetINQ, permease protein n=1 Tax=Campylobacter pinnipediorum subsp. caledonicus TaxID=1874362 RepID=A0A1S6U7C7_9BACT|nr:methionine ABC transporter permease [Campylobacter pinnipediorum]AQW82714.1 DL-methionine ABC transporter MetINQ, permease protein [Campylobacter pinnipediorum subsp. pinnipediorum]AQW86016.1 DL-methionine ABC transporter MetINQ, permease protein [Campylobacter pinnipediorum subsp. caledonicus]AQW87623.1 DL-methionine ABC transporter MetINQ, permease protein [Campylobacter pinnipediorum subsp. caledonicus]OPA72244.1 methionine ABC transporter permease [Campylobacter pinnipediorum subsp. cale
MFGIDFSKFPDIFVKILLPAINETLYMSLVSTILAFAIGLIPAVLLIISSKDGLKPNPKLYFILDALINTLRSFPFIILIIVLIPITRMIVGTSIGTTATIVPLTIGAAPFVARLIESAFKEVDNGIIEAAKSFGASKFQIIFRIMLVESLPSIISALTLTLIVNIGFSAMAGAVGGGGLGAVAINYGYQRFRPDIMLYTVVILVIMVHIFQIIGDFLYKITKK